MDSFAQRSPDVAAIAAAGGIAVQPIGATEQHGPHLPLATDAILAEALAERAIAKLPLEVPAWTLPTLAYGRSPEHVGRAGTVSLSMTTLIAVCMDVARAVAGSGIRTLVFVNAHGGNPDLLRAINRDIRAEFGVNAYTVHAPTLPLPDDLIAQMPRPDIDVHAGFYETSIMLALRPDAVALADAAPDGLAVADALAEYGRISLFGAIPLPWHVDHLTWSGTIGDPTGADAVWGEAALDVQSTALAEAILELATFRYPPTGATG